VFVFWDAFVRHTLLQIPLISFIHSTFTLSCAQEAVVWYFLCVETVGYTLEELDEIFSAPNPVKASVQKKKVHVHYFVG
jgi:hypothetical protein